MLSLIQRVMKVVGTATLVMLMTGCGGGGGSSSGGGGGGGGSTTTRVIVNVVWPDRGKAIDLLSSALSVKITLAGSNTDGSDFNWTFNRDAAVTAHSQRLSSPTLTRPGTWLATIKLYSQTNGAGTEVGSAGATAVIAADGSGLDTLAVTGTVSTVAVATGQSLNIGQLKDLVFTVRDASNTLIAVSQGSATWQIVSGGGFLGFVSGQAKGLADGDAIVTATVDGKVSPPASIAVGSTSTTLTVQVKDLTDTLIPNPVIKLMQNGVQVATATPATGAQNFPNIKFGETDVQVTAGGFKDNHLVFTVTRTGPNTAVVNLTPQGSPTSSSGNTTIIQRNGAQVTFEVDIAVVDADGVPITNLDPSAFAIHDVVSGTVTYSFAQVSVNHTTVADRGPYSAFLLLDASDSVNSVDPTGSRRQAVKTFLSSLGPTDTAMFGYFPASGGSANITTYPEIGFVSDGSLYFSKINDLGRKTFAGTPLYNAIVQAINYTVSQGTGANRAVIVFTDGKPTGSVGTLANTIATANANNVRIYTVGLGPDTNTNVLTELSQQTHGSTMFASDATQLVSFYKTLGRILTGTGDYYRTRWIATKSTGNFNTGEKVYPTVSVTVPSGVIASPFYLEVRNP